MLMFRRFGFAVVLWLLVGSASAVPAPSASPTPVPSSDPAAEALFLQAREAWRARADVPYLRWGALIRYEHSGHIFDNWWDAWARASDGQLSMMRLVDADEDRRRLGGIPFSIFGVKIFDTNRDAEPIRIDEPRIEPTASFGILTRSFPTTPNAAEPTEEPDPAGDPYAILNPSPAPSGPLPEIGHVEANTRDYLILLAGTDHLRDGPAVHLTLQPLRNPRVNRLRNLWLDPQTHRTMQLTVAGVLDGQPYNQAEWTVHYVELDGRNYVQQVVADTPLHFGFDTTIPRFEIDFVDYHFPTDVPKYTFDKPFSI